MTKKTKIVKKYIRCLKNTKNNNKYLKTTNRQKIKEIPLETVGVEPVSRGISFIFCRQLVNNSNCTDFNKGILRKSCNFYSRSCRAFFCEEFSINSVHISEHVHVFHENVNTYNVVKVCACFSKDVLDVCQGLTCLFLDCITCESTCSWINWELTDT